VTLRARWVTLRARWVTLRARWVTLRARWVTFTAADDKHAERAANAFTWLFGLQPQLLEMPRACFPSPAPTTWQRLTKPLPAAIVHLPGMVAQQREYLMRALGYWQPHPVDTHLQVTPSI
jgi:hypothetical protein